MKNIRNNADFINNYKMSIIMKKINSISLSVFLIACICAFSGCAKAPDQVSSPGIKIDLKIENNAEKYTAVITGGIKNENPQTVFTDFRAVVKIINSNSEIVLSFPVEFKTILPFRTAIVEKNIALNDKDVQPLLDALSIDREKLQNSKTSGGNFIDERNIILDDADYDKKDITDFLGEKINAKN